MIAIHRLGFRNNWGLHQQKFVEINQTGFRKILKKWDKRSKSSTKELYLSRQVEIQPCFNNEILADLTDIATTHLAELDTLIEQLPSVNEGSYPPALPQGHTASPAEVFTGITENVGDWESAVTKAAVGGRVKEVEELLERRNREGKEEVGSEKQERTSDDTTTGDAQEGVGEMGLPIAKPARQSSLMGLEQLHMTLPPTPDTLGGTSTGFPVAPADRELVSRLFYRLCPDAPLPALQVLLRTGEVNVNYADDISSRGPLHELAIHGRASAMESVFDSKINTSGVVPKANPTDIYGRTPLHYAGMYGRNEIASFLIRNGASVDYQDLDGTTPLIYAIKGGHSGTVQTLLNAGAAVEQQTPDSAVPLCLACEYGHLAVAEVLLARGCRVDVPTSDGLYPLHLAAREGRTDIALALLRHAAFVDPLDGYHGWTPLIHAAAAGHRACVKVFLDHGADRKVVDEHGWNCLTHALYRGHVACAKLVEPASDDEDEYDETPALDSQVTYQPIKSPTEEEDLAEFSLDKAHGLEASPVARGGESDFTMLRGISEDLSAAATAILGRRLADAPAGEVAVEPAAPAEVPVLAAPLAPSLLLSGRLDPNDTAVFGTQGGSVGSQGGRGRTEQVPVAGSASADRYVSPGDGGLDLDIIPHLSLPPPIVPFRIYGHNYLDKRIYFQVKLGHQQGMRAIDSDPAVQRQPLHLFGSRQLSSLKLIISTKPDSGIPYNVILPYPKEDTEPMTFLVDKPPALQFDIYPTFGSKVIARGVCLPTVLEQILHEGRGDGSTAAERCVVALVDPHLRVLGELCFEIAVVTPFKHPGVEIGGKIDTYWKSTRVVTAPVPSHRPSIVGSLFGGLGNRSLGTVGSLGKAGSVLSTSIPSIGSDSIASPTAAEEQNSGAANIGTQVVQSFVTASSLSDEYIVLTVQLTRDGVPVIYPEWAVGLTANFEVPISDLTADQFSSLPKDLVSPVSEDEQDEDKVIESTKLPSLTDPEAALGSRTSADLAKMVYASRVTLAQVLRILPQSVGVNVLIKYPTPSERSYLGLTDRHDVNAVVDAVLKVVYDAAAEIQRSVIFSSFNPAVCTATNWKQPNYAVFFCTNAGYRYMPAERPAGSQGLRSMFVFGRLQKKKAKAAKRGKKGKKGDKKEKGKGKGKGSTVEEPSLSGNPETPTEPGDDLQANEEEEETHEADERCTSIKEAIRFAKSANLLGIVCDARPLVQVPSLINTIKEGGLILGSFGEANTDPENVKLQESCGVDAIMVDNVVSFTRSPSDAHRLTFYCDH